MQFNYNTSIPQGGVGGDWPNQFKAMRTAAPPTLGQASMNSPVYQRNRLNGNQMAGMNRNLSDQFRSGMWQQANDMERAYQPMQNQLQMNQIQSANNMFNSLSDIFTQGAIGDRNNQMQFMQGAPAAFSQGMNFLAPLFSQFGGV